MGIYALLATTVAPSERSISNEEANELPYVTMFQQPHIMINGYFEPPTASAQSFKGTYWGEPMTLKWAAFSHLCVLIQFMANGAIFTPKKFKT